VLPSGDKGNTATGGISYGAYDGGGVLLSGEHHRRKPQGAVTGGGSKGSTATGAYAIREYCH